MPAWLVVLAALSVCLVARVILLKYWRRRCPSCGAFCPTATISQPFDVQYRCRKCEHEWWLVE